MTVTQRTAENQIMQMMIDVPNELGEQLEKLSRAELIQALVLAVQNPKLHPKISKKRKRISIRETPAFGMWADRQEMEDPTHYVRELRKPRSF